MSQFVDSASTMDSPQSLKRQLELARFDRALAAAESLAEHRALLTTTELARLNSIITGKTNETDPWRRETITITLPSGKMETLALIVDPVITARENIKQQNWQNRVDPSMLPLIFT